MVYSVDRFRFSKALPAPGPHLTAYPSSTTTCRESQSNIGGQCNDPGPLAPELCRILDMSFRDCMKTPDSVESVAHQAQKTASEGSILVLGATEDPPAGLLQLLFIRSLHALRCIRAANAFLGAPKFACWHHTTSGVSASNKGARTDEHLSYQDPPGHRRL